MKKALITGCNGQDGSYLMEFLLDKGYEVTGMVRRLSNPNYQNIKHILGSIKLVFGDMTDYTSLVRIIKDNKYDEVYNLAAQSSPGESFKQPFLTTDINGLGTHRLLEAIKQYSPQTKIYQASTSEMFGWVKEIPQNENTTFNPANPYAVSKVYAHNMAHIYRKQGVFVSCGILFNHESERRGLQFISQKIAYGVACISLGIKNSDALNEENEPIVKEGKIKLGNLDAERDWGYSPDYVECMWLMLQQDKPDDYIIATGERHSIKEFCKKAFEYIGKDNWEDYIEVDQRFIRPTETGPLIGDSTKAKEVLKWSPKIKFEELVKLMVQNNINKLK
jgi:GDPmannose 4,6-dehydratase